MLNVIVELYRITVAIAFAIGLIATVPIYAGFGLAGAAAWVFFVISAVGISAVLLSINDHLAAGTGATSRPNESVNDVAAPQSGRIAHPTALLLVIGLFILIVGGFAWSTIEKAPQSAAPVSTVPVAASPPPTGNSAADDLDANGCSPKLAASVGRTCD